MRPIGPVAQQPRDIEAFPRVATIMVILDAAGGGRPRE
jgi:hypothetical protein